MWDRQHDAALREQRPVGAILEVTNTPWNERTRYPLVLDASGACLTTEFDKAMHVSPFLGMDYRYQLQLQDRDDSVAVDIDVVDQSGHAILHTKLRLHRRKATRQLLGDSLRSEPFPTHRVSVGIHSQAARLWAKRVPVIPYAPKNSVTPVASVSPIKETP